MTEVNEEIVRQYLEQLGFFVRTDVPYFRSRAETGLKSGGWGDLDVLAWHPNGTRYLIEVKGWHTERFSPSYFDEGSPYVDRFSRKAAEEIFGSKQFKTVLVVPSISGRAPDRVLALAKKQGIDEIWVFADLLRKLIEGINVRLGQKSEILQALRLVKIYGTSPLKEAVKADNPF